MLVFELRTNAMRECPDKHSPDIALSKEKMYGGDLSKISVGLRGRRRQAMEDPKVMCVFQSQQQQLASPIPKKAQPPSPNSPFQFSSASDEHTIQPPPPSSHPHPHRLFPLPTGSPYPSRPHPTKRRTHKNPSVRALLTTPAPSPEEVTLTPEASEFLNPEPVAVPKPSLSPTKPSPTPPSSSPPSWSQIQAAQCLQFLQQPTHLPCPPSHPHASQPLPQPSASKPAAPHGVCRVRDGRPIVLALPACAETRPSGKSTVIAAHAHAPPRRPPHPPPPSRSLEKVLAESVVESVIAKYVDRHGGGAFCPFEGDMWLGNAEESKCMPPPYLTIRKNEYVGMGGTKRRREADIQQCECQGGCDKDCLCAMLFSWCGKECGCGASCSNPAFHLRPTPKLKLIKTEQCGWGVVAAEAIAAGQFVVEYVGEVIDDATCEQRLWDVHDTEEQNFYLLEVGREQTIDATFKGNWSRFINHSCQPNCEIKKWQVDSEVRVPIFAIHDISAGTELSYDYQFVPFGAAKECHCGAATCRGFLGAGNSTPASRSSRRPPVATGSKKGDAKEADVGDRVRIWWPLEQKFFSGVVSELSEDGGRHLITYDDGEEEFVVLKNEKWRLEGPKVMGLRQRVDRRAVQQLVGVRLRIWFSEKHRFEEGVVEETSVIMGAPLVLVFFDRTNDRVAINLNEQRWEQLSCPNPSQARRVFV